MSFPNLDFAVLGYSDITNIVEMYFGYQYNKMLALYYKVGDNGEIRGLTRKNHVREMFRVVEYKSKDFHLFVDHGELVPVNELKKDGVEECCECICALGKNSISLYLPTNGIRTTVTFLG
jgi:hypothetical protein